MRVELRVSIWRGALCGMRILLLLLVDVHLVALWSFVAIVVMLLGGLGLVVPGKRGACAHAGEEDRCKDFLHAKNPIISSTTGLFDFLVALTAETP